MGGNTLKKVLQLIQPMVTLNNFKCEFQLTCMTCMATCLQNVSNNTEFGNLPMPKKMTLLLSGGNKRNRCLYIIFDNMLLLPVVTVVTTHGKKMLTVTSGRMNVTRMIIRLQILYNPLYSYIF